MIFIYIASISVFLYVHYYIQKNIKIKNNDRPAIIPVKYLSFKNAMKTINTPKEYLSPNEKLHKMVEPLV